MNLADVMQDLGRELDTLIGLRVYRYPPSNITPPAAIVSYPESYTYDETYGRGTDRMTVPIVVLVGSVSDRASRDELGSYVDGSGGRSIKATLEAGTYTTFDSCRVMSVEFDFVQMAGVEHVAATFAVDIAGTGATA